MRIVTFNVNGLRSIREHYQVSAGWSFDQFLASFAADILCFQETKVNEAARLERTFALPTGYTSYCAFQRGVKRIGYSGVATLCAEAWRPIAYEDGFTGSHEVAEHVIRPMPLFIGASEEELNRLDGEGRCLITDHGAFCLLNIYFPNDAGEGRAEYRHLFYRRLFERVHLLLDSGRSIILVGDFNVTWHPMDHCDYAPAFKEIVQRIGFVAAADLVHKIAMMTEATEAEIGTDSDVNFRDDEGGDGAHRKRGASFENNYEPRDILPIKRFYEMEGKELRRWFYKLLHEGPLARKYGLRDVFRQQLHPEAFNRYTCWSTLMSARGTNHGTRLDGVLVAGPLFTTHGHGSEPDKSKSHTNDGHDHHSAIPIEACDIMSEVMGSDHCPVFIELSLGKGPAFAQPALPRNLIIHHRQRRLSDFFPASKERTLEGTAAIATNSNEADASPSLTDLTTKRSRKGTAARLTDFFPLKPTEPAEVTVTNDSIDVKDDTACAIIEAPDSSRMSLGSWRDLFHKPRPAPICKGHGEPCKLNTVSKRGPNQGRKFYSCSRGVGPREDPRSRCNHFEWFTKGTRGRT